MKRTNKLLRGIFVFMMLAVTSLATLATEAAARVQNYDRWRDLSSQTLLDMGNEFWHVDKIDSALVCFMILSNRYNEKLPKAEKGICCGATVGAANLYLQSFNDFQSSYRLLLKAEKIARKIHSERQLADIYNSKAALLAHRTDLKNNYSFQPEVLELFKNGFHQYYKFHNTSYACVSFMNLVFYAMKHGHINEIDSELRQFQAWEMSDSIQCDDVQLLCKGALLFREGKYQQALEVFSDLDNHLRKNISTQLIANDKSSNCLLRYFTLLSLNRDADALRELEQAEMIESENQYTDAIVDILHLKQEYFQSHGNVAMAKEYELKYYKAKDEFINRSKLLSVEQQQFLFELEEMGEEVKDLQAQKQVRDLVILGIGLLALIIIGILIFVWRNYQSTKQRNLVQYQRIQELLSLEQQQIKQGEKYKSSPMDDPAKDELLQRVYAAMESHQAVYEEGFTLDQLAQLVGANPNYVSQVINEKKGCNYNNFLNEYRIKEACRRLSDPETRGTYTVEAIGQSVGFKSRTNFTAIFKKFTGMTPAAYQRMARSGTSPIVAPDESQIAST